MCSWGYFFHPWPTGLWDLICEQAILPNLLFLQISKELKVQIVDLIFLRSSGTSLGHGRSPRCRIPVVLALTPPRSGPVRREDMLYFIQWYSPWPSEPLASIRRCMGPRKPGRATSCVSAPAPRHLALSWGLGTDILPFLASSNLWGVPMHSWHVPCLLSSIFIILILL